MEVNEIDQQEWSVMSRDSIIQKILSGSSDRNIRFEDLRKVLRDTGFKERIRGDHHIFTKDGIAEIINLQTAQGWKGQTVSG